MAFKRAPHVFVLISYGNNGPSEDDLDDWYFFTNAVTLILEKNIMIETKVTSMASGGICTEEE